LVNVEALGNSLTMLITKSNKSSSVHILACKQQQKLLYHPRVRNDNFLARVKTKMIGVLAAQSNIQLKEKMFYMFGLAKKTKKQTNKQTNIETHIIREINKVKLITSRLKFLHCKTVFISRESDVRYLIIF